MQKIRFCLAVTIAAAGAALTAGAASASRFDHGVVTQPGRLEAVSNSVERANPTDAQPDRGGQIIKAQYGYGYGGYGYGWRRHHWRNGYPGYWGSPYYYGPYGYPAYYRPYYWGPYYGRPYYGRRFRHYRGYWR